MQGSRIERPSGTPAAIGIVLVVALRALPLSGQDPDHRERNFLDPDRLAERVATDKEVLDHGLPEHDHLGGAAGCRRNLRWLPVRY